MNVRTRIVGKFRAARALAQMVRDLRNWREFWDAYRGRCPCPPLLLRSGLRLEHGPDDDIISLYQEVFARQDYTAHGFYAPQPGDVVLDIGANIGTFAIFLQHRCRGVVVHCFEPSAATRQRLEHNLRINRLESMVHVHPVGVSDAARTLTLHGHRYAGSRSVLAAGAASEGDETIECVTLAEAVQRTAASQIALLKIDVEGAEVDILCEPDPAVWARIDRVTLEFHGSLRPGARQAVTDALVARGYRIAQVFAPTSDGQDGVLQATR